MRETIDSFLRFLADNLSGVTIHPVRRSPDQPDSDKLAMNAVNVKFMNEEYSVHMSGIVAVIDVVYDDELTGLDIRQQLWSLLSTRLYTEKYDYTIPASPVATGELIFWEQPIKFRPISSPLYSHFHCRLPIKHHIQ